jgi:hypothetical protein
MHLIWLRRGQGQRNPASRRIEKLFIRNPCDRQQWLEHYPADPAGNIFARRFHDIPQACLICRGDGQREQRRRGEVAKSQNAKG